MIFASANNRGEKDRGKGHAIWAIVVAFICILLLSLPSRGAAQLVQEAANPVRLSASMCTLAGDGDAMPETVAAMRDSFDCSSNKLQKATDHFWLLADISEAQAGFRNPVLRYRTARHGDIVIHRRLSDGRWVSTRHDQASMTANWRAPWAVAAPLLGPDGERPDLLLVSVDRPWDPTNLSDLEIWEADQDIAAGQRQQVLSALFAGLIFGPLLLNIVFFATLRQRFVLFHSLMLVSILASQIFWTGLIFDLVPGATMIDRSVAVHLLLPIFGFAICMLVRSLCDPIKLGPRARTALPAIGMASMVATLLVILIAPGWPLIGPQIFHGFYSLMVLTVLISLVIAAMRGDRMAMLLILGLSGFLVIAILRLGRALGWLDDAPIFDAGFHLAVLLEVLVTSAIVGIKAWQLRQRHDLALEVGANEALLARTDPLTRIMNRRGFMEHFRALESNHRAPSRTTALILVDIDHFKQINDRFGHEAGDVTLMQLADMLRLCCRKDDVLARFGGEEFAILARCSNSDGVHQFAERIKDSIAQTRFGDARHPVGALSVSIGVAEIDPGSDAPDFDRHYRAADRALYRAKNLGRNRICYAGDPAEAGDDETIIESEANQLPDLRGPAKPAGAG
ncbi:MAG: diguanylate cyclase [Pseudomonadota bacterium]